MSENSNISWTDHTHNEWIGCTRISIEAQGGGGCDHCYAAVSTPVRVMRARGEETWGPGAPRHLTSEANRRKPYTWNNVPWAECMDCRWRGDVRKAPWSRTGPAGAHPVTSEQWRICPQCGGLALKEARARVFCSSLSDVFDNEVDPAWRAELFRTIGRTQRLDWLLLTKRIGNAHAMIKEAIDFNENVPHWPWPHVAIGATMVNREELLHDGAKLKATPAHRRFWSLEPLLGDFGVVPTDLLPDWVIIGGESDQPDAPPAREFRIPWARSVVKQCQAAGVPVHVKQIGSNPRGWCAARLHAGDPSDDADCEDDFCDFYEAHETGAPCGKCAMVQDPAGRDINEWPPELRIQEFPT